MTTFTQQTNAYRDRCAADSQNADDYELDVVEKLYPQPEERMDERLRPEMGTPLCWNITEMVWPAIGIAIRPRHNTAAYWE